MTNNLYATLKSFLGRHIAVHLAKCHTVNIDVSWKATLYAAMPALSLQVTKTIPVIGWNKMFFAMPTSVSDFHFLPESGNNWKKGIATSMFGKGKNLVPQWKTTMLGKLALVQNEINVVWVLLWNHVLVGKSLLTSMPRNIMNILILAKTVPCWCGRSGWRYCYYPLFKKDATNFWDSIYIYLN